MPLRAGKERAVAATKTYTAQLLALAMMSAAIDGARELWDEIEALPGQVEAAIAGIRGLEAAVQGSPRALALVVVGRGLQPLHRFRDRAQDQGDELRHRRSLLLGRFPARAHRHARARASPCSSWLPGPKPFAEMRDLAARAKAVGAPVRRPLRRRELLAAADAPLPLADGAPEWLAPVTAVALGQLRALALARARGLDPDAPRGLAKVTLTR